MNDPKLYEQIPKDDFPVRLHDNKNAEYLCQPHWHEHFELHFIFSGRAVLKCGNEYTELKENDCALINCNELHECVSGRCSYICLILSPSFIKNERVVFERTARDETIISLFNEILKSVRSGGQYYQMRVLGLTYILLSHLLTNYAKERLTESEYIMRSKNLDAVNLSVKYINQNYTENISSGEIADAAHLSKGYFCHIFKNVMGRSVTKYINELRLAKAAELLKSTDMNITEAALCSGFSDPNYFARVFKREFGKTPREYRTALETGLPN